ncbi:hypothetical protein [Streptomyces sp. NPDC001292]|uniref:IS1634 family transposase n=1 Tax=Streptomyces sp. NPDC001292 TaxID=3364558 RepID=UPI0036C4560B
MRRILVHSTAVAAGQRQAREKRLARAREETDKLAGAAGGRHYKTREKIAARAGVVAAKRRVTACLRWSITTDEHGTPALAWHFDQDALDAEAAVDGWYALLTSIPAEQAGPAQVLIHYKGQSAVERRYHDFKGPLAVAPVFVQHNRRVAALIQVICLALLVFCLIERQVRRALGPEQTMTGLYPDNRRVRPTGRVIFYHLGEYTLRIGSVTDPPTVQITRGVQLHLLDLPRHRHHTNPLATDLKRRPAKSGSRRTQVSSGNSYKEGSSSAGGTRRMTALICGNDSAVGGGRQFGPGMARTVTDGTPPIARRWCTGPGAEGADGGCRARPCRRRRRPGASSAGFGPFFSPPAVAAGSGEAPDSAEEKEVSSASAPDDTDLAEPDVVTALHSAPLLAAP